MPRPQPGSTSRNYPPANTTIAAADIGSNAIRLMVATVSYKDNVPLFKKEQAIRLPIRIGAGVFADGKINKTIQQRLTAAMHILKSLTTIYQPQAYRICATSAFREAENNQQVVKEIKQQTNMQIDIIDAHTEAKLIYGALCAADDRPSLPRTLHIDVGGGSTELIYGTKKSILHLESFATGTVRRQHKDCTKAEEKMKQWLDSTIGNNQRYAITASGGNARNLYKIAGKNRYIAYHKLLQLQAQLSIMSVSQRTEQMKLAKDRADTIVHAGQIYLQMLYHTGHKRLYIPSANLIGGIMQQLATQQTTNNQ